jgi:hypothetical protein
MKAGLLFTLFLLGSVAFSCRPEKPLQPAPIIDTPQVVPVQAQDTDFIYFPKRHATWIRTYDLNYGPSYPYYQHFRDSIFVSDEWISLKVFDSSGTGTIWREYRLLKARRKQQKHSDTVWEDRGIFNYAAIREDTAKRQVLFPTIYGQLGMPVYPPTATFTDYPAHSFKRKDGTITTEWGALYKPNRLVTRRIPFGNRFLEKQYFIQIASGDTSFAYLQPDIFIAVFEQARNFLPNSLRKPNAYNTSAEFRYKGNVIALPLH